MKPGYNNYNHSCRGALWRRVATGEPAADVLSRGRIGRIWNNNACRTALPALFTRNRVAFGRHRLLRSGVFGLLRRHGFSLSPERYLHRPLSSPLQITLARNGAPAIHYGGPLPRPLSVVNHNTSHHKTSRYRQINQQFTRQWHDYRQLNVISHIGLASPVMNGTAALRFRRVQRALLRLTGHAQTANGIFTARAERFWMNGDTPVVTGLAPSITGLATVARLITHTLYNDKSGNIGRTGLPSLSPPTGIPPGVNITGRDALQATLAAFASVRNDTLGNSRAVSLGITDLPVLQAINRGLRRQAFRRTAPLLRLTKLSLPVPLLARVARMQRRGERWRLDGLDDGGDNPSWLSLFAELSPLYSQPFYPQPLSRQPALPALKAPTSPATALSQRALLGSARYSSLLRNRDTLPGTHSGFILAARNSAGLSGLVVAMRGPACKAVSRDLAPGRHLPRLLSQRRPTSVTLAEHGQFIQRQQMRAQHAIAELCRNQEQQRQNVQRRDERIFTELRQQLQALQRSGSNEQAALLKAVQSLERVLTQTLKTTPASALRPLSFMGNR